MQTPAKMRLLSEYIEDIRERRKTTTIRMGKRKIATPELIFESFISSIQVQVLSIRHENFSELTKADAQKEGFDTLEELKAVLYTFYPNMKPHTIVTIIEFKV